jgi:hypothetical protein
MLFVNNVPLVCDVDVFQNNANTDNLSYALRAGAGARLQRIMIKCISDQIHTPWKLHYHLPMDCANLT